MKKFGLVMVLGVAATLSACTAEQTIEKRLKTESHYWQRANASDAIYQRGPKAQHMLNRDISRCVTELRELERLGSIRYNTPGNVSSDGRVPDPETPEGHLAQWETPERDGYMRYEHLPYHDFETCMGYRGWERIDHVPYDVAQESRETYLETITQQGYRSKINKDVPYGHDGDGDYGKLND